MKLDVASIVEKRFPPDAGKVLAEQLLKMPNWDELDLDTTQVSSSMLVGSFYFSFLHRLWQHDVHLLPRARKFKWTHRFPFQAELAREWIREFRPN